MNATASIFKVECLPKGVYVEHDVPRLLTRADGRTFPIRSTARHVKHGRAVFGNLVERFDVFMDMIGEGGTI